MPSTYPRMKNKDRNCAHPPHSPLHPPQTPGKHSPQTPSTPSSQFLSPIQESRILSWRGHITPEDAAKGSKSAPATLEHDPSCTGGSSHHSREKSSSAGQSISRCSCSSSPHQHHTQSGRPPRPRQPGTATPSNTNEQSGIGKGHKHQHQMRSYYSSKNKSSTTSSSTPQILSPPMARGTIPSGSPFPQQAQHGYDTAPMGYSQAAPQIQPPVPQMQPPPPPPRPDPPRIAGARDPISQNYWRGRFPPVGGPMGINSGMPFSPFMNPMMQPGTYPPQAFGMGGMGPWA